MAVRLAAATAPLKLPRGYYWGCPRFVRKIFVAVTLCVTAVTIVHVPADAADRVPSFETFTIDRDIDRIDIYLLSIC